MLRRYTWEKAKEKLLHDRESEQFVARYIERAPLSLEKLSIQDDIVIYTTKDGAAHACPAVALREGGSLMLSSF
jgi:hypothetical protein